MAQGVYWQGQDGNTYIRTEGMSTAQKWQAPLMSPQQMGLSLIDDPVNPTRTAPRTVAPSNPNGVAAPRVAPQLNTGAVNNTQRTIDQLPGILQAALEAEGQRYQNTVNDFGVQEQQQRGTYNQSTEQNQLNYDANYMDSIRAGSKGLAGLMQVLRGTGAAGGTVDDEVRDIVGGITATDIRTGSDTQKENQTSLDGSLSGFLTDLDRKRRMNEDTRANNESALRRDNLSQLQDLYGKMAGFYGDAERTGERDSFMAKAGSLTPDIARNSRTTVSAYDTTPVAVQAPKVTAFAAPSQPDSVAVPNDGQVGSGIFSMNRRRDPNALAAGV